MNQITSIKEAGDLRGKKVLMRADFNVPIEDGKIMDDYRIKKTLPTIMWLKDQGVKVIIISHIETKVGPKTLKPVAEHLQTLFPVTFLESFEGENVGQALAGLAEGEVILFENLRNNPGEEDNDPEFARMLASLGEIYINEAFSCSHRSHASIVGIPRSITGYAGILFMEEVEHLKEVFHPPHPFLFILGGAKFDTKLPLIQKFLTLADYVFVAGALANNLYKEKGYNVGNSLVSDGDFDLKALFADQRVMYPEDVTVQHDGEASIKMANEVVDGDVIYDAGPKGVEKIKEMIKSSKCVLWNGPLGNYEKGFKQSTLEVAQALAQSDVKSIVGGGDTLAAIAELKIEDKIKFISTGGGAMLQFLLDETLPGIKALEAKNQ